MPHVSMEYAIMVPILLVQVVLIPVATGWIMDIWVTRRRETALQDVASHLGTTIQQLYFSLNREEISVGTTTQASKVPAFIESVPYLATASNRTIGDSTIIDLYLALIGTGVSTTTRITLGPNVVWQKSTFMSNSTDACIIVEKSSDNTLSFSFG